MRTAAMPATILWPVVLVAAVSGCGRAAESVAPAAVAPSAATASLPTATAVDPDPRIGAVFLAGEDTHVCTGSVLHSTTGDLVLTAAHCLADGVETDFVPAFAGAPDAAKTWRVTAVYLDPRWVATQDPLADYAIVRVARDGSGPPIEPAVGSALSLGSAPPAGSTVAVTGYPFGVGGGPLGCRGSTGVADRFPSLACAGLVDGTSGAPWIVGSTVTGITGGLDGGGCDADVSYTPPFDDATARLLARAEAGGPGDAAPSSFEIDC